MLILRIINSLFLKTIILLYSVFVYAYVILTVYQVLNGVEDLSRIM
jgi:hypothetical protein